MAEAKSKAIKRVPLPSWTAAECVTFFCQLEDGTVVERTLELPERTQDAALELLPEEAFAFITFTSKQAEVQVEDEKVFVGKTDNISPKTYIGGEVYSAESMKVLARDTQDQEVNQVAFRMFTDDMAHVIKTRTGLWQQFSEGDERIAED